jgi:hypothetical protein
MSSHHPSSHPATYGLLAEFDTPKALLAAAERVKAEGYVKTDGFSPFPIHGLDEAIGFKENKVAPLILAGGITGLLGGFGLQYWTQVIAYPMTILFAAFAAVFGMLAMNGLPQPYHPVFNAPRFKLASSEKFFLLVEAADPKFDADKTRALLASLGPREVVAVDE